MWTHTDRQGIRRSVWIHVEDKGESLMRRVRVTRSMVTRRHDNSVVAYRHNGTYDMDDGQAADLVARGRGVYVDGGPTRRRPGPAETKPARPPEAKSPEPAESTETTETTETTSEGPATETEPPGAVPVDDPDAAEQPPRRRGRPRLPRDENGNILR